MTSAMTTYLDGTVQIAAASSRPRVRLKYRTPTTTTATTASEDFPVSTTSEDEEEVRKDDDNWEMCYFNIIKVLVTLINFKVAPTSAVGIQESIGRDIMIAR